MAVHERYKFLYSSLPSSAEHPITNLLSILQNANDNR